MERKADFKKSASSPNVRFFDAFILCKFTINPAAFIAYLILFRFFFQRIQDFPVTFAQLSIIEHISSSFKSAPY